MNWLEQDMSILGHKCEVKNDGYHVIVDGCYDVWPTTQKYKKRGSKGKAKRFDSVEKLSKLIKKSRPKPKPRNNDEANEIIRSFVEVFKDDKELNQRAKFLIADAIEYLNSL